jgi:hypothetical protein
MCQRQTFSPNAKLQYSKKTVFDYQHYRYGKVMKIPVYWIIWPFVFLSLCLLKFQIELVVLSLMPTLTAKRFLQEALAFSLYLLMSHCFCSTLLFSSNYSIRKPNSSLFKRFLFPYSVDSYSSAHYKQTEHLKNQITFPNISINVMLMSLFALQHSLMAHGPVRRYLQKLCTKVGERAVYIAASWLVLHFIYIFWRPISCYDSTLYHLPPIIERAVDFLFICG